MSEPSDQAIQRIADIERMRSEGMIGEAIARELGITRRVLYRFIKRWQDRGVMA